MTGRPEMKGMEDLELYRFDKSPSLDEARECGRREGYNLCHDAHTEWLPSEDEIWNLVMDGLIELLHHCNDTEDDQPHGIPSEISKKATKAIAKRLGVSK